MWKRFKNWLQWTLHPMPPELRNFSQAVKIKGDDFVLTPAKLDDLNEVVAVESAAYAGETPWPYEIFAYELNRQHDRLYIVMRRPGTNTMVGYIGAAFKPGLREVHITNIAINPEWQSRGLGKFLIVYLMSVANQINFTRMSLEVRASNTRAQQLYQQLGFTKIRTRHAYYEDQEDAFDMALLLGGRTS
ncbi:MAG: ribosomal protein S18-alanine N-acetyltransferase [Lactobacillaceae bacterium]|jgi:ribosomal-protein-alanine N-acetyltransferase|nr:ribosomal protein S18-alanine N-acetyltransferase [Lactobacillaceae bacterium]